MNTGTWSRRRADIPNKDATIVGPVGRPETGVFDRQRSGFQRAREDLAMSANSRFEEIVRTTPWLMEALVAARGVDAPEWLIGAGALRNAVWDRLHGFAEPTPLADVDVGFFDPHDLSDARDDGVEAALRSRLPGVPWQAKNQAAVHLWYPRRFGFEVEPFASAAEAVATFPETATAVAVRLEADDSLTVTAPYGLDDLLGLVHRHNPRRATVELYEQRLASKRIAERWPRVTVVAAR
jgi:uncharacterized protein